MNSAVVVFTLEEIAAIAQAYNVFSTLAGKIQTASPDAWAAVTSDFKAAQQGWSQTPPTVKELVERSGALPGVPTGLSDGFLAQAPGLTVTHVSEAVPAIDTPVAADKPVTYGGDESSHVQDVTPHPPAP